MPLCPQITNTPITVVQNADFTVSSVLPVVAATTTQVNVVDAKAQQAFDDAANALAEATTAYNKAVGSLQPSASTIVNASNQITAMSANGITVYSGASATSGARVVMNSVGLAGYDASNNPTFSITASTGSAVFSGSVTGATITGSNLNIAGKFIVNGATGQVTATDATITGTIYAGAGYIGSEANGWNFSPNGFLTNNGGSTILYPTTAPGGNANIYSIFTDRGVYAERLFITSTTATAVYSSGGLYALGALNVAASSGTPLFAVNTSGAVTAVAGITSQGAISSTGAVSGTGLSSSGSITSDGAVTFVNGSATQFQVLSTGLVRSLFTYNRQVSSARTLLINSSGDFGNSTSTRRHKHEIESYKINSSNLLKLQVKQYKYLESIDHEQKTQHGFIAEEAQELGLDELIQYDSTGIPDYFAYEKLPIFLLQLAQEQEARIKALEGK